MKKIVACAVNLLALVSNISVCAQQKAVTDNKSLLWRISGKSLAKPSFLFGTMHLVCADNYMWTPKMKECFDKSDKVCFEMNLADPAVMTQAAEGFVDKSGKKLPDYFTPAQYKILKDYFHDSLNMDISLFSAMKPMALESVMAMFETSCPNPISYEDSMMKTAQHSKKEVLGLEEPSEQLAVLDSIPVDTLVSQLMDAIQNKHKNDSELLQLTTAYEMQDLPALYSLIASSRDAEDNMGIFLDERNKKWISRIEAKAKGTSVFFAVGAGHLWGDNGVINLLRIRGFTVEPVK